MSIDLAAIQRRLKAEKRSAQLQRRPDAALALCHGRSCSRRRFACCSTPASISTPPPTGSPARSPRSCDTAIAIIPGVCLAELTYGLGGLDPADKRTRENRETIEDIIGRIAGDEHLVIPDGNDWAIAGMLAGMLKRTQRYGREQSRKALSDCLLFASALCEGLILLTANLARVRSPPADFPEARVAFYRAA